DDHANSAVVRWIDITLEADAAAPYSNDELTLARNLLSGLASASSADLPPVTGAPANGQVLRRRDLLDLFDTDPDLAGFDVDIAPYIRDTGNPQLQVYWRAFEHRPERDIDAPLRDELCPVSIPQARNHLSKDRQAFTWNPLIGDWTEVTANRLRPGMRLLLRSTDGGYDEELGFIPEHSSTVCPVLKKSEDKNAPEAVDSEPLTAIGCWVDLATHLGDAAAEAESIGQALGLPSDDIAILVEASRWHDVGKAHIAFQTALASAAREKPPHEALWAKSDGNSRLIYAVPTPGGQPEYRPHFRHELASLLAWLEHGVRDERQDLIAYLVAAHHGKVRMSLRALPGEVAPPDERLFARGVWADDELPAVHLNGHRIPPTTLRLDLMRLGEGSQGPILG
ncbi:MAG TPA: CRISPR-associated endonuclease Cas3'', partial [Nitrococcus sp.]|nr:CRISPR-associated endonuclease Cas3'' [Nitrococcus sp.]